jgi:hypothetical protein
MDRVYKDLVSPTATMMDEWCAQNGESMPGTLVKILHHNHILNNKDALMVKAKSVRSGTFNFE